jgi:biopolymer transport protein ExbD
MSWKILAGIGGLAVIAAVIAAFTVPVTTMSIKVDLPPAAPPASAAPAASSAPACPPIDLKMIKQGDEIGLLLNGRPTTRQRLLLDLSKVRTCVPEATTVVIHADGQVRYGDFMALINELQGGYRFSIVTENGKKPWG